MEKKGTRIFFIVMIIVAVLVICFCGYYLYSSKQMIKKYNGSSFKLAHYDIPTFNSVLKNKKDLVYANESGGVITLKYNIKNIKLNDVYAYLEQLSKENYTVVNLEDFYMRSVNNEKDIQIKINVTSNHLIFEYRIGIDTTEKTDKEKNGNLKVELKEVDKKSK